MSVFFGLWVNIDIPSEFIEIQAPVTEPSQLGCHEPSGDWPKAAVFDCQESAWFTFIEMPFCERYGSEPSSCNRNSWADEYTKSPTKMVAGRVAFSSKWHVIQYLELCQNFQCNDSIYSHQIHTSTCIQWPFLPSSSSQCHWSSLNFRAVLVPTSHVYNA